MIIQTQIMFKSGAQAEVNFPHFEDASEFLDFAYATPIMRTNNLIIRFDEIALLNVVAVHPDPVEDSPDSFNAGLPEDFLHDPNFKPTDS